MLLALSVMDEHDLDRWQVIPSLEPVPGNLSHPPPPFNKWHLPSCARLLAGYEGRSASARRCAVSGRTADNGGKGKAAMSVSLTRLGIDEFRNNTEQKCLFCAIVQPWHPSHLAWHCLTKERHQGDQRWRHDGTPGWGLRCTSVAVVD